MENSRLRNCPFCGERPIMLKTTDEWGNRIWVIECKNLGCILSRTKGRPYLKWIQALWNGDEYNGPK